MTFLNMVLAHLVLYAAIKIACHSGEQQDGQWRPLEDQNLSKITELKSTRFIRSIDIFLSTSEIIPDDGLTMGIVKRRLT